MKWLETGGEFRFTISVLVLVWGRCGLVRGGRGIRKVFAWVMQWRDHRLEFPGLSDLAGNT